MVVIKLDIKHSVGIDGRLPVPSGIERHLVMDQVPIEITLWGLTVQHGEALVAISGTTRTHWSIIELTVANY